MVARPLRLTVPSRGRTGEFVALAAWVAGCLGVSAIGGAVTRSSVGGWYQTLAKPAFNPPDWVFTPVWLALFVLMGIAAWRVWRRHGFSGAAAPLGVFAIQLGLNLGWSILFFGLRAPGWALVEIVVLWTTVLATAILFYRADRTAGWLLVPYLLWVGFAVVLNAAIWRLN
jgi:translocator protein